MGPFDKGMAPVTEISCDVEDAIIYAQNNDPNIDVLAHGDKIQELAANTAESPVEPFSKGEVYMRRIGTLILYAFFFFIVYQMIINT